jgi:hypothetical protein
VNPTHLRAREPETTLSESGLDRSLRFNPKKGNRWLAKQRSTEATKH